MGRGRQRRAKENVMVIQSRMIMGIAVVVGLGAAVWGSVHALRPLHHGSVEIRQVEARSWAVEITQLDVESVVVASQPGPTQ
jgi:hypothetical protein